MAMLVCVDCFRGDTVNTSKYHVFLVLALHDCVAAPKFLLSRVHTTNFTAASAARFHNDALQPAADHPHYARGFTIAMASFRDFAEAFGARLPVFP